MAKVAKLVTPSVTVRVVADEGTEELDIIRAAETKCINALQDDSVFDHFESIKDDEECPFGTLEGE